MDNPKLLSPSVLAFVGDAVYGLCVRTKLSEVNRPSGELHRLSVKLVNAAAQARAFELISEILSEDEMSIFKRGRNFHTNSKPQSASGGQYHTATGIESLFGYLYLKGEKNRADELFGVIWDNFSSEIE